MNTATRVGAFGAGLVVAFGAALGAGRLVGPLDAQAAPAPHAEMSTAGHGAEDHGAEDEAVAPAGLSATDQGYRLVPGASTVAASAQARVTFRVLGPDGRAVTGFTTAHEKELHLIAVRRDLSGFQHVHPTMAAAGTGSVALALRRPGHGRLCADFDPDGDTEGLVLGTDLAVPGDYAPQQLPGPVDESDVDGYTVRVTGAPAADSTQPVDFAVTHAGGGPVDLEPYLGADGHLVVLREGDLAYAHAHPVHAGSDPGGTGSRGTVGFQVEAPGPGRYRMFLDFKTGGTVRTAAFTADAGGSTP